MKLTNKYQIIIELTYSKKGQITQHVPYKGNHWG